MDLPVGAAKVTLQAAGEDLRPVVERLAQAERHDLSEFRGYVPGPDGLFAFDQLPLFFSDPGRRAHLIRYGTDLAGFTLTYTLADGAASVYSFFVVRALRRRGVGSRAAQELLRRWPGPWAICFQEINKGAARFWRHVAAATGGAEWREERRPVPPPFPADMPPDTWLIRHR
ncbi:GCN5-related N-acetyltransferase family protein [Streptomyces sp. NBRC 110611]|uniref:GNAT family N-acetyltransferase n=1 Tax=Streptomyces sp. NBRC 110611 TaxID=1621259 RepID=UPI00082D9881|nr:GNAT family N-acetyltransferase [Streptomyces sp. NBRC 110611]GAU66507.1 GCN5-related N-acetyltransferase family protein [Streptomyces sp. NBRC 110611]